jgi:zinc transport system substrate-binding protein
VLWPRLLLPLTAVLAPALALAGCSTSGGGHDGRISVVAGVYPFAFVAQQVGGDQVDVLNLTPPGAEPHDLELSPRQTAQVVDAQLVLLLPGFQPAFDDAVAQNADPRHVFDIATVVALQPVPTGSSTGEAATTTQGAPADPHVWLNPLNLALVARAVADRLALVDPTHAREYQANADVLVHELRQLDHEFRTRLANCAITTIITNHAAFGYLASRYGLTQVSISGLDPEIEPSPAQLADVVQAARAAGVTTVFAETLVNPAAADALGRELGVTVETLNPVEGVSDPTTQNYFSIMRANLDTLVTANQCAPPAVATGTS